jgi:hypothetical protein
VLRSAQILRDMAIYRGEKAGGRFAEAIYALGGVKSQDIKDVRDRMEAQADNQGLVRYLGPLIVGSLDPGTAVSVAKLELKSLPEGFDFDQELKWYISSLALGFGRDYQDFAPLPAGNLGTGQQSEVLHLKARGKGPAAFMRMLEQAFNFHGVMPRTVTFRFQEQDIAEEQQEANVKKTRAETRKIQLDSFEISAPIARQIAADDGDLKPEYLEAIGEGDVTPEETGEGDEKPSGDTAPVEPLMVPEAEAIPDTEKAMFRNLLTRAEQSPLLKEYLQQSAREIAQAPLIAGLRSTVQESAEVFQAGLVELEQAFDARMKGIEAEGHKRSEAMDLAVGSLAAALKDLETSRNLQRSVEEIEADAGIRVDVAVADMTVVEQVILKRNRKDRPTVVRKIMASGRIEDSKVIYENGKIVRLKRIY